MIVDFDIRASAVTYLEAFQARRKSHRMDTTASKQRKVMRGRTIACPKCETDSSYLGKLQETATE
jgi:hypothetical protein